MFRPRLIALAAIVSSGLSQTGSGAVADAARYVEGDVIVTFRAPTTREAARGKLAARSIGITKHFDLLSAVTRRTVCLASDRTRTTAELIETLRNDPSVESVEPDYLRWPAGTPDDSRFGELWGLRNTGQTVNGTAGTNGADIRFLTGWNLRKPDAGEVVVGIIDTGCDYTHPDLAANIWINPGEIPGNSADDDGNGYADDVYGYDFSNSDADPYDSGTHGTHVAGTIAAAGFNGKGVIGVHSRARIMPLKVSNDGNTFTSSAIISGLQYAVTMKNRGVNVVAINGSYAGGDYSNSERAAMLAAGDAGIVFCVAAGNSSSNLNNNATYPASYRLPNMVAVAATDQNDNLASFSNYGSTKVDLAAPGVNILSTIPVNAGTATVSVGGTSYSGPPLAYSSTTLGLSGSIISCGYGESQSEFPPQVAGQIALIKRGSASPGITVYFSDKVTKAMAAGAKAVLIYNNVSGTMTNATLQAPGNWIPTVFLSDTNGLAILNSLPATATVAVPPAYGFKQGTSMAAPHVTGAIALAAANFPGETVAQRIQRILTNADPKAQLVGKTITGARLNLQKSTDTDADELPDWWEQIHFGSLTGTQPGTDLDHDGMTEIQEYLAGTSPTSAASRFRITSLVRPPATTGATVTWSSVPGKTYQVLRSGNLGSWSADLPNSRVTAQTGQSSLSYTDPTAGAAVRRFYRIEVVAP